MNRAWQGLPKRGSWTVAVKVARESPGGRSYESNTGMRGTPRVPEESPEMVRGKCAERMWALGWRGKGEAHLESGAPPFCQRQFLLSVL